MTDEKTKPAWWRCPACKNRVWNDSVDKEAHRQSCPADLQRALRRLAGRIEELEKRETPEPVQLEAVHGPDLDAVDEADLDLETGPEDEEEPLEVPDLFPAAERSIFATEPVTPAIDDYGDDDEDEEQALISRPVMR